MRRHDPDTSLIRGPYAAPRCKVGRVLYCLARGDVQVCGISDARIPWPCSRGMRLRRLPVLCGDLIQAVRYESVEAVAYHWGVSRWTVLRWRRLLEVPRFNEGTRALWKRIAPEKLARARAARKFGRASTGSTPASPG